MGKRITDSFYGSKENFENRLLYARLYNPYDKYQESKYGYLDGAEMCIEGYKSMEELKQLTIDYTASDEYEKAYIQAVKDFIKYKEGK